MKKTIILTLVCVTLVSQSFIGCAKETTSEADKPIAVSVQKAINDNIENTNTFTGKTKEGSETSVTVEIPGTIDKVFVKLGQEVHKGDTLLQIKSKDIENSVAQAQAAYELSKASYDSQTGAALDSQENQVDNAIKIAKMNYDEAKRQMDINTQLYQAGVISEDSYKKSQLGLDSAEQNLNSAQKSYDTVSEKALPEARELAQKQLNQAETALETAKSNLDKLTLISPVDGIITKKTFNEHEMANQSQPAFVISNPDELEIDLNVTEEDLKKLADVKEVEVTIGGEKVTGNVKYVPIVTGDKTALYEVKISIDNKEHKFKAGMSVSVDVSVEKSENTIKIPKKAIIEDGDKKYVYIVDDDKKAVKTEVDTGIETSNDIEITSGVDGDDTVVIGGLNLINDGSNLYPVEKED
ncbi:efflux RND transporter periplasmic adaptor subunit [Clostridium sp. BJN0001]|uniref:efflux RND transporter periplasmic adaptor subunit n=1 Tax=Clostridium sp. BJN0001 TaxID=2930219 RepID=UPI001FD2FFCF|nr:efflux RND transporter periplasmic adaptor subunit [Clostridium sp. BJN0001]